ncbi:GTP cyclohydrolase I [Dyella jiangningensis]|uniref:GTP cyclohydrolase I n=1 Tax=Dyella sp. AtDHG13 TaxID=1938897 RepID=UPI000891C4C2|nr:GTP cyclohydrolase I [Dyella sp. AtDHG13]PXV52368.1 GTP cyclohydrolase I [Dyella sp. AtDHG13]SDL38924.1 GTP cyclohydrolase I [Dyella jiangningensis]
MGRYWMCGKSPCRQAVNAGLENIVDIKVGSLSATRRNDDEPPVSERIRQRILHHGKRFHANDNIGEFLQEGELALLQQEVAERMHGVLESLVIDTVNDHNTRETAGRLAKMYVQEIFAGRYSVMPDVTEFPNVEQLNELMVVGPLRIRSACSHHLCPIMGQIWIGVLPQKDSSLIGLSKYGRLVQWIMSRPQIQEEAVVQVADLLESRLKPEGLAVVLEADHYCMRWRGLKDDEARMVNSVMRGPFLKDASLRSEFFSLLPRR